MNDEKKEKNEITINQRLFLDKNGSNYIEFIVEENTTCQKIYDENKEKITEIIKILNKNIPKNFDLDLELELDNYFFCLILPRERKENNNEKEFLTPMIDLKLKLNENIYNIFKNNPKSMLCFLTKNNAKLNLRKNARSLFVLEKDIYENTQDPKLQDNTVKDNISEEILFKNSIFFYEIKNKIFIFNFIKKNGIFK